MNERLMFHGCGCGPFDGGRDEGLTNDKNNGRYAMDEASQVREGDALEVDGKKTWDG